MNEYHWYQPYKISVRQDFWSFFKDIKMYSAKFELVYTVTVRIIMSVP